jgi:hypothetical protein
MRPRKRVDAPLTFYYNNAQRERSNEENRMGHDAPLLVLLSPFKPLVPLSLVVGLGACLRYGTCDDENHFPLPGLRRRTVPNNERAMVDVIGAAFVTGVAPLTLV